MIASILPPVLHAMQLPNRVALTIGSLEIYWYGVFLAVGIVLAIFLAQWQVKRNRLPEDTAIDVCLIAIPSGIVGARLAYVLQYLPYYKADPAAIFQIWDGGLSIYGAIVAALIGLAIYSLCKKIPFLRLTDLAAPGLVLAQGLAKWGDFFNQEGYGPLAGNKALQWFPCAVYIEKSATIHYAAFFYEFIWCVLAFLFMWFIIRKRAKRDGAMTIWYLALYCLGHGLIEQIRIDAPKLFGALATETVICGILFILALIRLIARALIKPKCCAPAESQTDSEHATESDSEPATESECSDAPAENLVKENQDA